MKINRGFERLGDLTKRFVKPEKQKKKVHQWQEIMHQLIQESGAPKSEHRFLYSFAAKCNNNGMLKIQAEWKQGEINDLVRYCKWLSKKPQNAQD